MNVSWRFFTCTVALTVLLACSIADATSIGCFTTANGQVRLQQQPGSFTKKACKAACTRKQLPLYALYCGNKCACSASIPAVSAQTKGCGAAATGATCGSKIELQYIYSVGKDVCVLAPYPFTKETLDLGWRMQVTNGALTLTMDGQDGSRVQSRDVVRYGLFEITLQAAPGAGAVTTFYLTNQPTGKPNLPDEIDLEFVNAGKLFTEPNAFWTNVWASPNEQSIRKHNLYSTQIAPMIGDPSFTTTSGMHTYLVDWQPGYIRWYIQGVLVDQLKLSQGTIPSRPMYSVIALWAQTNATRCPWFGGCLPADSKLKFQARFANYKRVRCYNPKAPYFDTAMAAKILSIAKSGAAPPAFCQYANTPNSNTYKVKVKSTSSWGYVRHQLASALLRVYKRYGATDLRPTISGPQQSAARKPPTTWKLTVVVPVKRCAWYKQALRNALRQAIKGFKQPPKILGTTIA